MIIDGKAIAAKVRAEVAQAVKEIEARAGVTPGLALIRVGSDPASEVYVRGKVKACQETGMGGFEHILPETTPEEDLLALVRELNVNPHVHGVLVQLPLPKHISSEEVLDALAPQKDVDGFGPHNAGALFTGRQGLRPCTPLGIMRLLDESQTRLLGARALVVGRSNIVGKPVAMLLLERHATVTLAHSRTADLAAEVGAADVLVAAVGKAEMIRGAWVKPGATVIDVGINRNAAGKLVGDVEFPPAAERARAITPVPGGVGPMTIAYLLSNTIQAAKAQLGLT
ncbi:MAG: bifunctional methylenetetrahydrofolate dehydrogenase/methenyltetrahydrofolate cyclohydrolase [Deltaproteobacteria bacterium 13_1_40CM_4_68_19]|nr:MAG: bifunctional methylenetetrahydrofolate dehydrogenase/methenyltetrahydrofolate cyclohydrolase [Deltaproteobacteria bacterium 13_1_40CM_4_68_19]HMC34841.1 bifunctional methylenetetrahydrofolate dehydrogenase/methenyltetrahydrofolate cyclohydrolase FolD [Myxococcales bacterium]